MLYAILEKAINRVLQLDPDTVGRLGQLHGKVVKITFTDLQMDCYILVQERGVKLTGQFQGAVDTTIRGNTRGLIQAARAGAGGPALFEQGIEIIGDPELGEKIRHILRQVDLDGEEYLSRIVGDTAAHEIVWRAKRGFESAQKMWRSVSENIREFCQVEAQYLPARLQVETFYSQISCLRDDVDRAALRVLRLEQKLRLEGKSLS